MNSNPATTDVSGRRRGKGLPTPKPCRCPEPVVTREEDGLLRCILCGRSPETEPKRRVVGPSKAQAAARDGAE
jgi:hypothetical protein